MGFVFFNLITIKMVETSVGREEQEPYDLECQELGSGAILLFTLER